MNKIAIVEINPEFSNALVEELATVSVEGILCSPNSIPEDVQGVVIGLVAGDECVIPEVIYEASVPVYPAKGEDLLPSDRWLRKCTLDEFMFFTCGIRV